MKYTRVPSLVRRFCLPLGICLLTTVAFGVAFEQEDFDPEFMVDPALEFIMAEAEINGLPFVPGFEEFEDEPLEDESGEGDQRSSRITEREAQILRFSDGNSLHGSLTGIDSQKREILWHRDDASTPLAFPMSEVASFSTAAPQTQTSPSGKVTVKFAGSDWVAADSVSLKNGKLQVRLGDNSPLTVDRDRVEWIYFSKGPAPECYDGPTSMAGWVSDNSWTFQEGALRATRPGPIGRVFDALPDQVEYFFELDQNGGFQAFSINLRGNSVQSRGVGQGRLQIMFSATDLRMWAQTGPEMKMEQVDLRQVLGDPENPDAYRPPRNRAVQYRILEDYTGGRLIVFIDGRKAADWKIGKGEAGKNRGGFTFQPMVWNSDSQQSISRVRVLPWDGIVPANGAVADDRAENDSVVTSASQVKKGEVFELSATRLKLNADGRATDLPREQIRLVRFQRPEIPADEDVPVARVRLARRGEFDVSGMAVRAGQLAARTSFGGEVAFPLAAIRTVEFAGAAAPAEPAPDIIVFKNGDRLRGTLLAHATGQPIRWQPSDGAAPVEIQTANVLGVQLHRKAEAPAAGAGVLARFRNGDIITGVFEGLDTDHVLLNATHTGPISIARDRLHALYFARDGIPPVLDGATDSELWINGAEMRRAAGMDRARAPALDAKAAQATPWRYFNGAYTFQRPDGPPPSPNIYRGGVYLGRLFEAMPQTVEISFHVASVKMPATFSLQLFSEPNNPGYMMQCYSEGIFVHDMSPRGRGRNGVFQQQFPFEGKIPREALRRHVRILTDRPSGRMTIMVDGEVIGQVERKPSEGPRDLGRGFMLIPQMNIPCTFSDFWIGPWNGLVPGREPAGGKELEHSVLLANGDESRGTAVNSSPETMNFESEVGAVELPVSRLTMLHLGGAPTPPERGTRLRLVGRGALTVSDYKIEDNTVTCQSSVLGELQIPLSAVEEIAIGNGVPETVAQKKVR